MNKDGTCTIRAYPATKKLFEVRRKEMNAPLDPADELTRKEFLELVVNNINFETMV